MESALNFSGEGSCLGHGWVLWLILKETHYYLKRVGDYFYFYLAVVLNYIPMLALWLQHFLLWMALSAKLGHYLPCLAWPLKVKWHFGFVGTLWQNNVNVISGVRKITLFDYCVARVLTVLCWHGYLFVSVLCQGCRGEGQGCLLQTSLGSEDILQCVPLSPVFLISVIWTNVLWTLKWK